MLAELLKWYSACLQAWGPEFKPQYYEKIKNKRYIIFFQNKFSYTLHSHPITENNIKLSFTE
jgi:hypothetical protein